MVLAKRLLYVGSFFEGSTVNHRYYDFTQIFESVDFFNTNDYFPLFKRGFISIWRKLECGPPFKKMYNSILNKIEYFKPDVIFFDKSLYLPPSLLIELNKKGIFLIHFSNDDQLNLKNQTKFYLESIPFYDIHLTTKSYNVFELLQLNAKEVIFVNNCTSKQFVYPLKLSKLDKERFYANIGFIGTWEKERAASLLFLAKNGIKIRIWGPGWINRPGLNHPNLIIENKVLWGADYLKAICSTNININFLRKENRDLQTTRSIEIPACNAFMIAEFSEEHKNLFNENDEAVFFKSNEELLKKVEFYLENEKLRTIIARNSYNRCINSNYFYKECFKKVFDKILFEF